MHAYLCAQSYQTLCCPQTAAHQPPKFMGFSRQEYWSGLPFSYPGDIPTRGIKPTSLMSPALAGGFFTTIFKRDTKYTEKFCFSYI